MRLEAVRKQLDLVANVAIIVTCLIAAGVLLQKTGLFQGIGRGQPIAIGSKLPASWRAHLDPKSPNVVAIVRSRCGYCTASMRFYRELATSGIALIVVSDEPANITAQYLREHSVVAAQVLSVPSAELRIRGTPTLLFVDHQGVIRRSEIGLLNKQTQKSFVVDATGKRLL